MCDEGTVYDEDHSDFNQVIVNALYSRYNVISGMPLVCHVLSAFLVQRVKFNINFKVTICNSWCVVLYVHILHHYSPVYVAIFVEIIQANIRI